MKARIEKIELHEEKGGPRLTPATAEAVECGGLVGDRHCRDINKQISITGADVLEWMDSCEKPGICFEKFGANLVFDRIPDEMLEKGIRLNVGETVIDIQDVHKKCHVEDCKYFDDEQIAGCRLRKYVMYGECISAGNISVGDDVTVLEKRSRTGGRNTGLVLTPKERALEKFMKEVKAAVRPSTESVSSADALGRVAAADARARFSSPHYDSAAMDGIAVRTGDLKGASPESPVFLRPEDFKQVNTGNQIEPPYDAVVMAENVTEMLDDRVCIKSEPAKWENLRRVGENFAEGEVIVHAGHKIMPVDICALIEAGVFELEVYRKPKVAIFPTGDEIVEPEDAIAPDGTLRDGEIIDANSRMFRAMAQEQGAEPHRFPILPDDYDSIKDAVSKAAEDYDVIITNAGTSAGLKDYTVKVLNDLGKVIVHGVAIKPGKPCILAVAGGKPVIGLPGYPVSAYLGFREFVTPVLEYLSGRDDVCRPKKVKAVLTQDVKSGKRQSEYIRVKLGRDESGRLTAEPLGKGSGSSMLLVRGDGWCVAPQLCTEISAGTEVEVELYKPRSSIPALQTR